MTSETLEVMLELIRSGLQKVTLCQQQSFCVEIQIHQSNAENLGNQSVVEFVVNLWGQVSQKNECDGAYGENEGHLRILKSGLVLPELDYVAITLTLIDQ